MDVGSILVTYGNDRFRNDETLMGEQKLRMSLRCDWTEEISLNVSGNDRSKPNTHEVVDTLRFGLSGAVLEVPVQVLQEGTNYHSLMAKQNEESHK
jgi:bifunctional DNase/RNase